MRRPASTARLRSVVAVLLTALGMLAALPASSSAAWTDLGYTRWSVGSTQAHGCSSFNRADDYVLTVLRVKNTGASRWVHAVVYRRNSPYLAQHKRVQAAAGETVSLRLATRYGSGQDVAVIINRSTDHTRTPHASSGARAPGSLARC